VEFSTGKFHVEFPGGKFHGEFKKISRGIFRMKFPSGKFPMENSTGKIPRRITAKHMNSPWKIGV
jgi:hypothetical protein